MLEVGARFTTPKTGARLEVLRVPGPHEPILQLKRVIRPGTGKTARHVHRGERHARRRRKGRAERPAGCVVSTTASGRRVVWHPVRLGVALCRGDL